MTAGNRDRQKTDTFVEVSLKFLAKSFWDSGLSWPSTWYANPRFRTMKAIREPHICCANTTETIVLVICCVIDVEVAEKAVISPPCSYCCYHLIRHWRTRATIGDTSPKLIRVRPLFPKPYILRAAAATMRRTVSFFRVIDLKPRNGVLEIGEAVVIFVNA